MEIELAFSSTGRFIWKARCGEKDPRFTRLKHPFGNLIIQGNQGIFDLLSQENDKSASHLTTAFLASIMPKHVANLRNCGYDRAVRFK